jgi:hypothetical protein
MIGARRAAGRPLLTFIDFAILSYDIKVNRGEAFCSAYRARHGKDTPAHYRADHLVLPAGLLLTSFARLGLAFAPAFLLSAAVFTRGAAGFDFVCVTTRFVSGIATFNLGRGSHAYT